jgi:hypothetical protein
MWWSLVVGAVTSRRSLIGIGGFFGDIGQRALRPLAESIAGSTGFEDVNAGSVGAVTSSRADWARLTEWLVERTEHVVIIAWGALNAIVGGLPDSATKHYPQWWHGDRPNTRA